MTDHLKELSERATPGEWSVEKHGDAVCVTDGHSCLAHDPSRANAAFIVALVNAYRSGSLVPADQGRVEELEAENARLKEQISRGFIEPEDIDALHELFSRTMGRLDLGNSFLDRQALANINRCSVISERLSATLSRKGEG